MAEEVFFAFDASGHITITGISPGVGLLVPIHEPNDENAVAMRIEREHVLPLPADGTKVSGRSVPA